MGGCRDSWVTVMADKSRLLAWGDYNCATGFGQVMSNIMMELDRVGKYEIDVIGINHSGDPYDHERWPGRVWPAMSCRNVDGPYLDMHGRQRLLDRLGTGEYDVLFMLQDTFIVQPLIPRILEIYRSLKRKFKTVMYYPLDARPKPAWIRGVIDKIDYPVTYTNYAKAETLKADPSLEDRLEVIYHGTNARDFYYVHNRQAVADFRHKCFHGVTDGRFLVMNVNRNQSRKDIMRNFMVLAELRKRGIGDVMFYFHMQHEDVGGNIVAMADNFGLQVEKDFIYPHPDVFRADEGIPVSYLNMLYNSADAVFTTTLGEGWGLSLTEGMATRTPVIAPDNTSITEILAENRGIKIPCGGSPSLWITKEMDNERLRPLVDVEEAGSAIEKLMNGSVCPDLDSAEAFVERYSWANVAKRWVPIIDKAAEEARATTMMEQYPMGMGAR